MAEALRAVATGRQAGGEVDVCIGGIVEGATGVETRHDLGDDLVCHPTLAQFLPHLVGRARAGG